MSLLNPMPSFLDREIDSADADAFGHRHYAKALQSLVEAPSNPPPFSVGLLGKWGTGKSSIKAIYVRSLTDDRERCGRIHTIMFNAWRYGGEDIKRALFRQVFLDLGGNESELKHRLFHQTEESELRSASLKGIATQLADGFKSAFPALLVVAALALLMLVLAKLLPGGDANAWILGAQGLASLVAVPFILRHVRFDQHSHITRIEYPMANAEEYEDELLAQLREFKAGKTSKAGKAGKTCERLIVFVDDLDRLSAEEMISGLDAVRSFLEIPECDLPRGIGIVFVISCDEDRVASALAGRRQRGSMPGTVFTRGDARRFLDRIFQFRLEIPPAPKRDMRNFATDLLKRHMPSLTADLAGRGVDLDTLVDRMIHVDVQSPRNTLQILNGFAQAWWLAVQREHEGAGTNRPGGLHEGAVTEHPLCVAVLSLLRVDFPDFYDDLLHEPRLIHCFANVFLRDHPLFAQPEMARAFLTAYCIIQETAEVELKPEHRPLRRFVASIEALRWPAALQPLLLLSQDAVTRKFGDRANRVHDAFVSGDTKGVLAELGRNIDNKPFSLDEVRLLHGLVEELHRETAARQDNAASVIADVADRLPRSEARHLMTPLARRLANSPDLRWRLGVERIRAVLPPISSEDRREVVACLIQDFLRPEGESEFRLPSGGTPSLDELVTMTKEACSIVLSVRGQDQLDAHAESTLLDWLTQRRVAVSGRTYQFPFEELEVWMDQHESHLLSAMGAEYTNLVVGHLHSEATVLDLSKTLDRSNKVFEQLWNVGEESRIALWDQLAAFVSVKLSGAVRLAWEWGKRHPDSPGNDDLSRFVTEFVRRLQKEFEGDEEWALEREAAVEALLSIIKQRPTDLGSEAIEGLKSLCGVWSTDETTAKFSCRLLDSLAVIDDDAPETIVSAWSSRLMTDLPDPCIEWCGGAYTSALTDAGREAIANNLGTLLQTQNVNEEQGRRVKLLLSNMDEAGMKTSQMQTFMTQVVPKIAEFHLNPNNYLTHVFPCVPKLIRYTPPKTAGAMLHTLFTNAAQDVSLYGFLHGEMAEHWPTPHAELKPYNPQQIFDKAQALAQEHAGQEAAAHLLYSMRRMIDRKVVSEGSAEKLAKTACAVWRHHPKEAHETLLAMEAPPGASDLANLLGQTDVTDPEGRVQLQRVWSHLVPKLEDAAMLEGCRVVLTQPPINHDAESDLGLRLWMDAADRWRSNLLSQVITDKALNDEQKQRIWLQVEQRAKQLGQRFFIETLPLVFGMTNNPKTIQTVLESTPAITDLFSTKEDRFELGKVLSEALASSTSNEVTRRIAEWIKSIGAVPAAEKVIKQASMDEDRVALMRECFPESKELKRLAKTLAKKNAD